MKCDVHAFVGVYVHVSMCGRDSFSPGVRASSQSAYLPLFLSTVTAGATITDRAVETAPVTVHLCVTAARKLRCCVSSLLMITQLRSRWVSKVHCVVSMVTRVVSMVHMLSTCYPVRYSWYPLCCPWYPMLYPLYPVRYPWYPVWHSWYPVLYPWYSVRYPWCPVRYPWYSVWYP